MALELRFGKEYSPLMRRYASDARTYSALSIKMDPLAPTVARREEQYPDCHELAAPIREAIDEAMESIQQADTEEPNLPALIETSRDEAYKPNSPAMLFSLDRSRKTRERRKCYRPAMGYRIDLTSK